MEIIFFLLLIFSIYSYSIYPPLVLSLSRLLAKPWRKGHLTPRITMILSVFNEEKTIEEKIRNSLSLHYPEGLFEMIVISDGSNDHTNEIISRFQDSRLILKAFGKRSGKTACLNLVIPEAKGDILLFTDANSIFPLDIIPKMTRNFFDDRVGLVTGWTKYRGMAGEGRAGSLYSRMETKTKHWESLISSCVGADGAIFAVRKTLYKPLEREDINDFVLPLQVISQGKRVVLDPEVYCFEDPSQGKKREFLRQARITNRTLRAVGKNLWSLNPISHGTFSLFLLSHKVLRFSVPFFICAMFLTNLLLLKMAPIYLWLMLIQLMLFAFGLMSMVIKWEGRFVNIWKFLLITFAAQLVGWLRFLRGIPDTVWIPQR